MKQVTLIAVILATLLVASTGYFAYSSLNRGIQDGLSDPRELDQAGEGIIQRPRPDVSERLALQLEGLSIAQEKVTFDIKNPSIDALPAGFTLKGVRTNDFGGHVEEGVPIIRVSQLFWDKPIGDRTSREIGGAIWTSQQSTTFSTNSTAEWEKIFGPNPDIEVLYLFGYPTYIRENQVVLFKFDEQLLYRVDGEYPTPFLLKILESLIRG